MLWRRSCVQTKEGFSFGKFAYIKSDIITIVRNVIKDGMKIRKVVKRMAKLKKVHLFRPELIIESKPKFIGIPLACLYWLIRIPKIFKFKILNKKCWYLVIPKFKNGIVTE